MLRINYGGRRKRGKQKAQGRNRGCSEAGLYLTELGKPSMAYLVLES